MKKTFNICFLLFRIRQLVHISGWRFSLREKLAFRERVDGYPDQTGETNPD
jgi:hypothetical protein